MYVGPTRDSVRLFPRTAEFARHRVAAEAERLRRVLAMAAMRSECGVEQHAFELRISFGMDVLGARGKGFVGPGAQGRAPAGDFTRRRCIADRRRQIADADLAPRRQ